MRASAGTRTRILCLEGTNTTLVLRTHSFMHVTIWAEPKILRTKINFHDSIASSRPNGATAARWIPDPKAGGSNPSSVTHPPGGSSVGRAVDCKARRAAIHWSAVQICLPGVAFFFLFFFLRRWLAPVHRARPGLPSYGHITAKTPDPIRTPKLSAVEPDQYYGGGPRGNLGCRMAAMHRLQSSAGRASGC